MNPDSRVTFANFLSHLSADELRYLTVRLIERVDSDLATVLEHLSKKSEIDAILAAAVSAEDLYDMCDAMRDIAFHEMEKKNLGLYPMEDYD